MDVIEAGDFQCSPDLLWRLERAEARNTLACAESRAALYDFKAECRWMAGGYGIYAGHWTHLTQGVGIGASGPVRPRDLVKLADYFVSRGTIPTVYVSEKLTSAFRTIAAFGFRDVGEWMILGRRLRRCRGDHSLPYGVEVPRCSERSAWIQASSQGFANRDDLSLDDLEAGSIVAGARDTTTFMIRKAEEIVATAALACRSRVALFFADSTRRNFRGCGLQTTLIAARIREAAESGCRFGTACAMENSSSERNYRRMGFARLYRRIVLQYPV